MRIYALKNNQESKSASGGAFPTIVAAIAKLYPNDRISVFGATFNEEFKVVHSRVVLPQSIDAFKGSKYVYSSVSGIYEMVEKDITNGYIVVFSGTPCQCDGLKKYLDKKKISLERMVLIDIICHGTAIPSYWNEYVKWIQNKFDAKLYDFSFRYQQAKWKRYPVKATFITKKNTHKVVVNTHEIRSYTRLFFTNMIMRELCYSCRYANINRVTDLTIGDFWGIEKVLPDFPYTSSVSQVLVSSEKGTKIIEMIKASSDATLMECMNEQYLRYQHNLNVPTERPFKTDDLKHDFENNGIEYVLKKYAGLNVRGFIKHIIQKLLKL